MSNSKDNSNHMSKQEAIDKFATILDFNSKPADVTISTMTLSCALNTEFNIENIVKYFDLNYNGIISISCGDPQDEELNKTLVPVKKNNPKKNKKKKKYFYNQVTLQVKTGILSDSNSKVINVKLFDNGAIQMTGCKDAEGSFEVLDKIFKELRNEKYVLTHIDDNDVLVAKPFAKDISVIDFDSLNKLQICMINSNFNIGFCIDRAKLFECLYIDKIKCKYEPIIYAGVNIKFNSADGKEISIFVFEKGSILITGADSCKQINAAYEYINKYLLTNYKYIVKNENVTKNTIMKYMSLE
jgi:TATA-box binding protein (TBP) (component of TFIID and TFIIIB)